jgi:hypothetical protein
MCKLQEIECIKKLSNNNANDIIECPEKNNTSCFVVSDLKGCVIISNCIKKKMQTIINQ